MFVNNKRQVLTYHHTHCYYGWRLYISSVCLTDGDWEVCLHSLRLLQSVLLEEEVLLLLGSPLLDPDLQACVSRLTSSAQPSLRLAAQQILEDLQALQQVPQSHYDRVTKTRPKL